MKLGDYINLISILSTIISIIIFLRKDLSNWYYTNIKKQDPKKIIRNPFEIRILCLVIISSVSLFLLFHNNKGVFDLFVDYKEKILDGVLMTLYVSISSIIIGTIIGVFLSLLMALPKSNRIFMLLENIAHSFIYILLGIPALVLLFLFYYIFAKGFDPFWSCSLALGINLSPFVAKIVIGSIENISQEQNTSAIAFGYNSWQRFWYFQVKYVVKNSCQPLLVQYYTTIKLSSLAGMCTLYEAYHVASEINQEVQNPESVYIMLAICYVAIVIWFAVISDYLELKLNKSKQN
jgi:polar amino acid transport system permease protein